MRSELGVPRTDDFNAAMQEGVGYYQLFTRNGLRCSTAIGYLRPVRDRSNLEVQTDARVTRVVIEEVACDRCRIRPRRRAPDGRSARAR